MAQWWSPLLRWRLASLHNSSRRQQLVALCPGGSVPWQQSAPGNSSNLSCVGASLTNPVNYT